MQPDELIREVDRAVGRLSELDHVDLAEHPRVYAEIHGSLGAVLDGRPASDAASAAADAGSGDR